MNTPRETRAAVLYECDRPLVIETLMVPQLLPGQVAVKTAFAGLCHSQLNEIRGKRGVDKFLPHLLGHEASGTVTAVGPGVAKVSVGDFVVLSWIKGAGLDAPGPQFTTKNGGKKINSGPIAALTEYAIVAENRCTPIDKKLPMKTAALLGCAIPTGAGMVLNQLKPRAGDSIVIFGVGGVGLSALMAADLLHCDPIIAIDVQDDKLDFARKMGATHIFNALSIKELEPAVRDVLPKGADFVIEASGVKSAMESAYRLVRDGGGCLVIAGNLPHQQKIEIDPFSLICGRQITGTWGGQSFPPRDFPTFTRLNLAGKFPFDKLVTNLFSLDQVNEAFSSLENGANGRLLISFE